jgi:hypothetical protein
MICVGVESRNPVAAESRSDVADSDDGVGSLGLMWDIGSGGWLRILEKIFSSNNASHIVNAKTFVRIPRKTRFLKKAGFPDLSGKKLLY